MKINEIEETIECPGCGVVIPARDLCCDQCWRGLPEDVKRLRAGARSQEAHQYAVRTVIWKLKEGRAEARVMALRHGLRGVKLTAVAHAAGMGRGHFSNLMTRRRRLTDGQWRRVKAGCRALGITLTTEAKANR